MTVSALRFGVWALTHGSWASRHHPLDPPDASWRRIRRQIRDAEALGYDSTLLAQHIVHPSGDDQDLLENWTGAAALAAVTNKIELISAIEPLLVHPVVLAKMALQIENISEGRFAINLVNAWYRPELERAGIGFPDHDDRYAYGREWIEIVEGLTSVGVWIFGASIFASRPISFVRLTNFDHVPRSILAASPRPRGRSQQMLPTSIS